MSSLDAALDPPPRVAVVGAGVIGLTTAVTLAREGCRVTVLAGRRGRELTSSVAGASWYPYSAGRYQRNWAANTYHALLADSLDSATTGVQRQAAREFIDSQPVPGDSIHAPEAIVRQHVESLWWRRLPGVNLRVPELSPAELSFDFGDDPLGRRQFAGAVDFTTLTVRMDRYLSYLEASLRSEGGELLHDAWVGNLRQLARQRRFAAVVNCAGFAAEMFDDSARASGLRPVAGQVVRARAPAVQRLTVIHTGAFAQAPLYVVPRAADQPGDDSAAGEVTLGGSYAPRDVADPKTPLPDVDELLTQRIIHRCRVIEPALADMQIAECRAGLRPVADALQVGLDREPSEPGEPLVFNNFGHGGGGVSLSWGTAAAVTCDLVRALQGR